MRAIFEAGCGYEHGVQPIDDDVALPILAELANEDLDAATAPLDSEFSYAQRDSADGDYVIRLSTLPWREGETLALSWLADYKSGARALPAEDGNSWQVISWWEET